MKSTNTVNSNIHRIYIRNNDVIIKALKMDVVVEFLTIVEKNEHFAECDCV